MAVSAMPVTNAGMENTGLLVTIANEVQKTNATNRTVSRSLFFIYGWCAVIGSAPSFADWMPATSITMFTTLIDFLESCYNLRVMTTNKVYYKVQFFNTVSITWVDIQTQFLTLDDATRHIDGLKMGNPCIRTRVMHIDYKKRTIVEPARA